MKGRKYRLAGLALGILLVGCGPKVDPIGPGYVFQPDEKEQRLWQKSEEEASQLCASGALYPDPALEKYVNSVLLRLLGEERDAYRPLKARVYIVDSTVLNAFTFSDGQIFLHTGILGRLRNEAQLAMLLGHEITHSTHRHLFQQLDRAYTQTALTDYVSILSTAGGGNVYKLVSGVSELITQAAIMGYSRDKEEEADRVGLTLMARAGYDPREGAAMFQRMLEAADPKDRDLNFLYATHPKMKERIEFCRLLLTEMPPELLAHAHDVGSDRYLNAAIRLIHGEVHRQLAQGKYALVEETLANLLTERPEDPASHALLGELCRIRGSEGDMTRAEKAYLRALELEPFHPVALRGLGTICLKEGARADALKYLRAYVESSKDAPDRAFMQQTIEQLQHEQDKQDEALD